MTTDRNEQIVAAYAAGEDTAVIAARVGVTADDIRRIVADGTFPATGTPAAPRRNFTLATVGWLLLALGFVGPCLIGAGWLAVYYLSAAMYPVSSWGYGNIAAGLAGILVGAVIVSAGGVVLMISRGRRR
jgi:hypothetical protein